MTVLVKGYIDAGDEGGGLFIWKTEYDFRYGRYSEENFGTIIKSNQVLPESGSWVRQFSDYINVTFFGAFGIEGNNYTVQFQNAINFAQVNSREDSLIRGSTVYIPNGVYEISTIKLYSGVNVIGESISKTQIFTKNDKVNEYLFTIDIGQVYINISNLNIRLKGGIESDQIPKGGFLFEAKPSENPILPDPAPPVINDGGLWYSTFKNIRIDGLYGNGIYLKGGEGSVSLTPNQFNVFENVRIFKNNDDDFTYFYNALKMTGENGQHTFINCQFDGVKRLAKKVIVNGITSYQYFFDKWFNVMIESQPAGSVFSYITSHVVTFLNCTFQNSFYGVNINYAENITFDNCWFEDLGVAIMVKGDPCKEISKSINILNNRFTNAAGFGSTIVAPPDEIDVLEIKKGQCVSVTNSVVNITNNYITASYPKNVNPESAFVLGSDENNGINLMCNTFRDDNYLLSRTFGVSQFVNVTSPKTLSCKSNKLVLVKIFQNITIDTINSTINTGETISIRAYGKNANLEFTNNDNIFLSNKVNLILKPGEIATFIKIDYGQEYVDAPFRYQLLSYVNSSV